MQEMRFGGSKREERSVWRPWRAVSWDAARIAARASCSHAFLKVNDRCEACGEEYHHHRADDSAGLYRDRHRRASRGVEIRPRGGHARPADVGPYGDLGSLTMILSVALLQPVKGAVIGLQWANRMHGFGGDTDDHFYAPAPAGLPSEADTNERHGGDDAGGDRQGREQGLSLSAAGQSARATPQRSSSSIARAAISASFSGRRSRKHAFMPGRFVFPGGRTDPADSRVPLSRSAASGRGGQADRYRQPREPGARPRHRAVGDPRDL
jgi:hypothetical protein